MLLIKTNQKLLAPIGLVVLLVLSFSIISFLLGKNYEQKNQQKIVEDLKNQYTTKLNTLEDEKNKAVEGQNAAIEGRGVQLSQQFIDYDKYLLPIYSPLFEGKKVNTIKYSYKNKLITERSISLGDNSSVDEYVYENEYNSIDELQDFVIFSGYENYELRGTPVDQIRKNWKESYINKNNLTFFYEYSWTPKSIGVVSLSLYKKDFPDYRNLKPTFITVSYSVIGGYPVTINDPLVIFAKKEAEKLADTISLVIPDSNN